MILQVRSNFRTAITVPEKAWPRLRDVLNEYLEKSEPTPADASGDAKPVPEPAE